MTDPLVPARSVSPARRLARRLGPAGREPVAAKDEDSPQNLPAVVATPVREEPVPPEPAADAAVAAQVMGQGGQKRGLRGGPPVLSQARATYLQTEWSGPADRRVRTGIITKTEI